MVCKTILISYAYCQIGIFFFGQEYFEIIFETIVIDYSRFSRCDEISFKKTIYILAHHSNFVHQNRSFVLDWLKFDMIQIFIWYSFVPQTDVNQLPLNRSHCSWHGRRPFHFDEIHQVSVEGFLGLSRHATLSKTTSTFSFT